MTVVHKYTETDHNLDGTSICDTISLQRVSARLCSEIGSESDCSRPRGSEFGPSRHHTFVETDHEILSTVIFLHPLIQEGLQKYVHVHGVLVNCLV